MIFRSLVSIAALGGCLMRVGAAAPTNDKFNSAAMLTGANITISASNVGASKEVGEPNHGANSGGKSVWWRWTAPGAGSVIIQTTGSSVDTLLGAYRGSSLGSLELVAGNDDNGTAKTSLIGFNVTSGATYSIAVDGYNGNSGDITLALSYRTTAIERPRNDNFANAIGL